LPPQEAIVSTIIESIEVDVPVRTAYDQWTQFEDFPKFMDGVQRVEQVDDATLRWTAKIGGVERSWTAEITDQQPDTRIAWRSIDGAMNAGVVTFQQLDPDRCQLSLQLDVEPTDAVEKAGDALGLVKRQAAGDLHRFKEFIEARREPTGAWRGEVHQDGVRG
jgi:uncharacterized membrane protein